MIKKAIKTVLKLFSALFLLATLALVALFYYGKQVIYSPIKLNADTVITINKGENVSSFTRKLVTKGWINNRFWIRSFIRLQPELTKLKAGTYKVAVGTSQLALFKQIVKGDEHHFSITFIEGSQFKEWLTKLNEHPKLTRHKKFSTSAAAIAQLAQQLGIDEKNPEGLFFPDTYSFLADTAALDILKRAHETMNGHLNRLWQQRAQGLPYKSPYQALIMASIIEKESGQVSEQATISSVFVNRLKKKMRLQTDPTVIYGLGDSYKGDITYRHLREKTPYNTYRINGLPPTPIAMPGLSALKAAMQPASTPYLYFVSRGNGYHQFSKTLREHNNAVNKYILNK